MAAQPPKDLLGRIGFWHFRDRREASDELDDDYVAYIRESIRGLAPGWEEIGLFELSTFRQGFIDEVRRLSESEAET